MTERASYDCMTPEELAEWRDANDRAGRMGAYKALRPCVDCPLAFRATEYAAGRCRLPKPRTHAISEEARAYKREWMQLWRARQKAAA